MPENCSVCLEELKGDIRTLPCKHQFHTHCMAEWARQGGGLSCPLCRWEPENQFEPRPPATEPRRRHVRRRYGRGGGLGGLHGFEDIRMEDIQQGLQPIADLSAIHDLSDKELIFIMMGFIIIIGILGISMQTLSTCMCGMKWDEGETTQTIKHMFGSETTYIRPEMCTYVC